MKVGIDKISYALPNYYVDMVELAQARNIDPDKFTIGIGQEKMAYALPNEDIVSLAANAAMKILDEEDKKQIDQVVFSTESGIDFSKSAGTYLLELLELPPFIKTYEIKHACYGTTAALLNACDYVTLRPQRKVLVVSADIAKYGLATAGESTQGAGAIAMLISANPRIMEIEADSVAMSSNAYDFWRPLGEKYPLVQGKYSTELYMDSFEMVLNEAIRRNKEQILSYQSLVFHTPFTKMGQKALINYANNVEDEAFNEMIEKWQRSYQDSVWLNRQVGNIYTGSLYLNLISLLASEQKFSAGDTIGLFSYGSGVVAELFTGILVDGYHKYFNQQEIIDDLNSRQKLSIEEYEQVYEWSIDQLPQEAHKARPGFYLEQVVDGQRQYVYKSSDN